jgi:hypothetical protein
MQRVPKTEKEETILFENLKAKVHRNANVSGEEAHFEHVPRETDVASDVCDTVDGNI